MPVTSPAGIDLTRRIALLLCASAAGCDSPRLPAATKDHAEVAARECDLAQWEWTSGIFEFDGDLDYPDGEGITFLIDATGLEGAALDEVGDRVDEIEACLVGNLTAQGVGTNIVGGTSFTLEEGAD
jgi:hypothetical protein